MTSNPNFSLFFSSNYRHRLVLKIPFPWHIFPSISKYRTENLYFPSIRKYNLNIKFHFIINIDFFQRFCFTVFNCNVLYLNASAPFEYSKADVIFYGSLSFDCYQVMRILLLAKGDRFSNTSFVFSSTIHILVLSA